MKKDLLDKANPADRHPRTGEGKMTAKEMFCAIHTRQLEQSVPIIDRYPRIYPTAITSE
jgi:hypothetical protein